MEESENKEIEKRKSKISEKLSLFFKEKENKILVLILIFALALRIFFLITTKNQPLWWDESEYLSTAKYWILNIPYSISEQRQPFYPLVLSVFYLLKITNLEILKFLTVILPSIGTVLVSYLLIKEMFDKTSGLIVASFMSFLWVLLFWTNRFSTDILGFLFGLLAFYLFWTGYVKSKSRKKILLMGLFLTLGILTRIGNLIFVLVILVYLIIIEREKFLKNKYIWLSAVLGFVVLIPYLIWNKIVYNNPFIFFGGYFGAGRTALKLAKPIAWNVFNFIYLYLDWFLLILFLIGLGLLLFNLFLGLDILIKKREDSLKPSFFLFLMIIIPLIFFIFIERNVEDRWLLIMAPAMFYAVALAILKLKNLITKNNKQLSVILIIIFIVIGFYFQFTTAKDTIDFKKDSYAQLRDAGLWIKANTNKNDAIFSSSVPENTFYSERITYGYGSDEKKFEEDIIKIKPKYMVLSVFDKSPEWAYSWPDNNKDKVNPVQAYYLDAEKKQVAVAIYEFI